MKRFRVSEIFGPTIQGEGRQIGRPTVFVRFGGCDYRCSWCDSLYAVLPEHKDTWESLDAIQILDRVQQLSGGPILVTLSGGNPALWDLSGLIQDGKRNYGFDFTLETQGSLSREWFAQLDHLCISPKPPSSGMVTDWERLNVTMCIVPSDTILKVVVMDNRDDDFEFAQKILNDYPEWPLYLQVGNTTPTQKENADPLKMLRDLEILSQRVIAARMYDVRVLPQLHALMWGNQRAV